MNERTIIDLFAGLGGFSLAASWNGVRPAAQVEINPHCLGFLERAWPNAKHHADIRTFDAHPYRGIWAVMGGPPCQPASRAGEQRGAEDDRWLWGDAIRVVDEARPAWCLFENPPGILDVGIDGILADLERLGYEVQPLSIPACAVDSPQDRDRIWILGHYAEPGQKGRNAEFPQRPNGCPDESTQDLTLADPQCQRQGRFNQPSGQTNEGRTADSLGAETEPVADSQCERGNWRSMQARGQEGSFGRIDRPSTLGAWSQYEWLPCPDPKRGTVIRRAPVGLYDVAHGLQLELPKGVCGKLLEALGNSIVPEIASEIIKAMIRSDK